MPAKPSRSLFVPLLIVGMLVGLFLFATLVPLVECKCVSNKYIQLGRRIPEVAKKGPFCKVCGDSLKVPFVNIWPR